MNKSRLILVALILLVLLNIGTLIILFLPTRKEDRQGPPGRTAADFIIGQLHLDASQQEKFAELRMRHQDAVAVARREDRRLHDMYFNLLKNDQPDKTKADSVSRLIADQRRVIEEATFIHFEELRKLCRDDQKKLFDATIDEIARMIGPKGPPPHPGVPPPRREL